MSLYSITNKSNCPLEVAHLRIDSIDYDIVECCAVGQPKLDLSDQLRRCSFASTSTKASRQRACISMYSITTTKSNNWPLDAAHAHIV